MVFNVETECQLMTSLCIIRQFYTPADEIWIYLMQPEGGSRLKSKLNFEGLNIKIYYIHFRIKLFLDRELKRKYDEIVKINPDDFYFFLEVTFWIPYILRKLKKVGTRILLAPDGVNFAGTTWNMKSRIDRYIKTIIYLWSNKMFIKVPFPGKYYASNPNIDCVMLWDSKSYTNFTNRTIVRYQNFKGNDKELVNLINNVFCFKDQIVPLLNTKEVIVWFDQPLYNSEAYLSKLTLLLKTVCLNHENRVLIIKTHPHSHKQTIDKLMESFPSAYLIKADYPAELYIANMRDAILLSINSMASVFEMDGVKSYWLYPLFPEAFGCQGKINYAPGSFVRVINSIDEI